LYVGYPRTINQAKSLDSELKVDHVVALNVPNDEIVNRLKDRWVHAPSGRVYNLLWSPPKVAVRFRFNKLRCFIEIIG
jgi:adenylate kinase family enzyme